MSQSWTDNPYASGDVANTDLTNMNNNFACIKSSFSGNSQPSNPVAGMYWFDTSAHILKVRNEANSAWLEIYHAGNDQTVWKNTQFANGVLSADATGRAKMAANFITNGHVNDVDGSKVASNSLAGSKFLNNSVGPDKIAAGASTLIAWSPPSTFFPPYVTIDQDWTLVYIPSYIPAGAKYIVLSAFGNNGGGTNGVRLNISGSTGCQCNLPVSSAICNSSAWDISTFASSWRTVLLESTYSSGTGVLYGVAVQWWGA